MTISKNQNFYVKTYTKSDYVQDHLIGLWDISDCEINVNEFLLNMCDQISKCRTNHNMTMILSSGKIINGSGWVWNVSPDILDVEYFGSFMANNEKLTVYCGRTSGVGINFNFQTNLNFLCLRMGYQSFDNWSFSYANQTQGIQTLQRDTLWDVHQWDLKSFRINMNKCPNVNSLLIYDVGLSDDDVFYNYMVSTERFLK